MGAELSSKPSSFLKWSTLQLPNRDSVKDAWDVIIPIELTANVCYPQLGGCTPQLPAKCSCACPKHSPSAHKC